MYQNSNYDYYSASADMKPTTGIPVTMSSSNQYYTSDHQSQPPVPLRSRPLQPWSTGLCDCGSDVKNCCITCWCPCVTFGQISEIVDKGSSSCGANGALYALISLVTCCGCLYSCFYRAKMRQQHTLEDSPCGDCLVHCCCEYCALCQEYRELQYRGFNMSIGWHGNVEERNREMAMGPMAPAVEGGTPKKTFILASLSTSIIVATSSSSEESYVVLCNSLYNLICFSSSPSFDMDRLKMVPTFFISSASIDATLLIDCP